MVSIKEKVYAEFKFIDKILEELEIAKDKPDKELVIIVGICAYLQNIYKGIENILKQLLKHKSIPIPNTSTWHKDLINSAIRNKIIKEETANKIGKYLFFRHFFTHSYGFQIDEEKLKPLIENIPKIFSDFKKDIDSFLSKLGKNNQ